MKNLAVAVTVRSLLTATGELAQNVSVNWQTDAPFSDDRTHAWKGSKDDGGHFFQQWVEKEVDSTLSQKGLRSMATGEDPDPYLSNYVMTREAADSATIEEILRVVGAPHSGPWQAGLH